MDDFTPLGWQPTETMGMLYTVFGEMLRAGWTLHEWHFCSGWLASHRSPYIISLLPNMT